MHSVSISPATISENAVESAPSGPLPPGSVCLFAAYTPNGNLPPYTCFYLKNLKRCGLTVHIVLSGCSVITEETRLFCNAQAFTVWHRPNGGLDFGAWRFLLGKNLVQTAPYIVFANDSVFGPLAPLPPLLRLLQADTRPAWGLVASRAVTPHLQSWFIGFSRTTFEQDAVQRVFSLPFEDMTRAEIIWHGELGLSVALRSAGIPLHALWSDESSPFARIFPTNPMHSHWRSLIRSGRVPFLKQELLRDNPFALSEVKNWRSIIPPQCGFDPDWIETYLSQHPPRSFRQKSTWKGRLLYKAVTISDYFKC